MNGNLIPTLASGIPSEFRPILQGYKQTEMGVIPEDWDHARLSDVATVKGGKRLPSGFTLVDIPTEHPYLRVADMYPGGVDQSKIKYVPEEAFSGIRHYRIYREDIFISVAGTLGIVGVVPPELEGANLTENADRITDIKCERDYLKYWLMSQPIQQAIESIQTIGAQPKLALGRIAKFDIAIPRDSAEQRAIVEALSDVDSFLRALTNQIAKKQAIKQAAMQQLLTGKTRLPRFKDEWSELNMARDFVLKARIGWQGLTTAEYLTAGKYFLVTGTDFVDGCVDWSRCCYVDHCRFKQDKNIQLRLGDVLLTKDGTIGKAGFVDVLPGPATLNSGVFVIRPKTDACVSKYMYYVLTSHIFEDFLGRLQAGSTISHLYQKDFVNFSFAAPQIDEQRAIVDFLSDMDTEIIALGRRRNKTYAIRQGMIQQLLTGRVRLITSGAFIV